MMIDAFVLFYAKQSQIWRNNGCVFQLFTVLRGVNCVPRIDFGLTL